MGNTPPLKLFQYKEYFIIEEFKEDYFPEMKYLDLIIKLRRIQ